MIFCRRLGDEVSWATDLVWDSMLTVDGGRCVKGDVRYPISLGRALGQRFGAATVDAPRFDRVTGAALRPFPPSLVMTSPLDACPSTVARSPRVFGLSPLRIYGFKKLACEVVGCEHRIEGSSLGFERSPIGTEHSLHRARGRRSARRSRPASHVLPWREARGYACGSTLFKLAITPSHIFCAHPILDHDRPIAFR
jgi:hypothetical protein